MLFAGNWTDLQVLIKDAAMNANHQAVLHALFNLAQNDEHATVLRVANATGLARAEVVASLAALGRAGLADADRVRLTMQGLASVMLGAAALPGAPRLGRSATVAKNAA